MWSRNENEIIWNFYNNKIFSLFQTNTCPLDRKPFKAIIIFNRIGGNEIAREKCKPKAPAEIPQEVIEIEDERRTLCERCNCGDRAEVLLLCDGKLILLLITLWS